MNTIRTITLPVTNTEWATAYLITNRTPILLSTSAKKIAKITIKRASK